MYAKTANKSQDLYNFLSNLLHDRELLWTGESDYPIEAVSLKNEELRGWQYETQGYQMLLQQTNRPDEPDQQRGWEMVWFVMRSLLLVSFRRPTDEPSVYDLLIVTHDGAKWQGFKTKIVEA